MSIRNSVSASLNAEVSFSLFKLPFETAEMTLKLARAGFVTIQEAAIQAAAWMDVALEASDASRRVVRKQLRLWEIENGLDLSQDEEEWLEKAVAEELAKKKNKKNNSKDEKKIDSKKSLEEQILSTPVEELASLMVKLQKNKKFMKKMNNLK